MKNSIIYFLFVFAVCAFSANMVFAQKSTVTPIAGIPVGLEHDPEGIAMPSVKTDVNGKFACKLSEGKYKLVLSYNDIASKVSRIDKNYASNPGGFIFTLLLGQTPNVKAPAKVILDTRTDRIIISVAKGGGTLSGTLTYTKR